MNTTLQELTDKIYAEGVEKGKEEAAAIVEQAKKEAESIVAEAKKQADELVADAERKIAERDKNSRAELQLYAAQSVQALQTEATNLICDKLANDSVKAAVADGKFMQKIILTLTEKLANGDEVVIETADAKALKDYFAANAKELLAHGVEIKQVNGIKTNFTIEPKKGGYKLAFGQNEFVEYFKQYLRPELVELLFN